VIVASSKTDYLVFRWPMRSEPEASEASNLGIASRLLHGASILMEGIIQSKGNVDPSH